MATIHTLADSLPPPRYDGIPWTSVRIEEATTADGPWAEADTLALDPVDADPAAPAERDLTFSSLLTSGWYRLVWTDADGNASPPSEAVASGGAAPEPEALARLRAMTAAEADPPLSETELTTLLAANALVDAEGRRPAEDGWTPSYSLGAAAEDGWLLKAGKVAARVDGGSGGMTLARSQLYAHCMDMAERYSMRRSTSLPLAPTVLGRRLPVFNRNDPYFPNPLPDEVGGAL